MVNILKSTLSIPVQIFSKNPAALSFNFNMFNTGLGLNPRAKSLISVYLIGL